MENMKKTVTEAGDTIVSAKELFDSSGILEELISQFLKKPETPPQRTPSSPSKRC